MQLSAIELPTTYFVISKQYGNNFFTLSVNGSTTVIHIPDGNYNQDTIMTAINNQLSLAGAPFNLIAFVINLTNGTGSGQTLVGEITSGTVTSIELNFQADRYGVEDRNTPLPLKFGWFLGFRNGIYVNNLNYVSEGIADITGPKYLFLVVDDYNNRLARISLQSSTFDVLEQNNLNLITTPREYFGPVNIQTMNIQLLDEYGRVVNLNNMDFSFCLTLTTVYDI